MTEWMQNAVDKLLQMPWSVRAVSVYGGLPARDKLALKVLLGFLGPVLLVFGLIMPAYSYMQAGLDNYEQALEDFRWIEANKASFSALSANEREPGQSLFGLANATSKGFQINFKRYEPVGENALSLWMENISFNSLILWLERLDKRHGVSVKEIAVERLGSEGLVNVRLVLQG